MFRGNHHYSVDDKGRVAIPARFREELSRLQDERLVVTRFKRQNRPCLDVYPLSAWQRFEERIAGEKRFGKRMGAFESWYVGAAQDVQVDTQGRMLIPPTLRDYAGMWNDHPGLAVLMTIFLLSLGGFPPLGGFIAKWYVFTAAVKAGYNWLAIIGVLTSVVSVFFYLRVIVMMYMTPSTAAVRFPKVPPVAATALVASALIVFYLGVLPTLVLDWAAASISTIF